MNSSETTSKLFILIMQFWLHLPRYFASIAIEVLGNEGPQWAQRVIRRYERQIDHYLFGPH